MKKNECDVYLEIDKIKVDREKNNKVEIEIEELSKKVSVDIPSNIKDGDVLKLKGLGYDKKDGTKGDVYITFVNVEEVDNNPKNSCIYKVINDVESYELEDVLNNYGDEGWHCVNVDFVLVRLKPSSLDNGEYDSEYNYTVVFEKRH